jgi:hypothetical protein
MFGTFFPPTYFSAKLRYESRFELILATICFTRLLHSGKKFDVINEMHFTVFQFYILFL